MDLKVVPLFLHDPDVRNRIPFRLHQAVVRQAVVGDPHPLLFAVQHPSAPEEPPRVLVGDVRNHGALLVLGDPELDELTLPSALSMALTPVGIDHLRERYDSSVLAAGFVGHTWTVREWSVRNGFGPRYPTLSDVERHDISSAVFAALNNPRTRRLLAARHAAVSATA